jgi:DNA-binding NarL/FixJ family response regulator
MSDKTHVRVALIEDHTLVRESIAGFLRTTRGLHIVALDGSLIHYLQQPARYKADLVILDLDLEAGEQARPDQVERLIAQGAHVLVVSALGTPALVKAMLAAGVAGIVSKRDGLARLGEAIQTVLAGEHWTSPELAAVLAQDPKRPALSAQEERALVLYASGLKLDAVARRLGVAPSTAKQYIDRVREKYADLGRDARTKTELYAAAVADGLLKTPPSRPARHYS